MSATKVAANLLTRNAAKGAVVALRNTRLFILGHLSVRRCLAFQFVRRVTLKTFVLGLVPRIRRN
jgi:hypothetical protein